MSKARRRTMLVVGAALAFLLTLWLCNEFALVREQASPNEFDLGTVYTGSTVEFSAKFLVSSGQHPLDALFERVVRRLPKAWELTLSKLHPKNIRHEQSLVDLSTLKPVARAPSYLRVTKLTPEQRKAWYKGSPYVIGNMSLNTERPGKFTGNVRVTMSRCTASLPVKVTVVPRTPKQPHLLIASTPYEAYTTENGSHFRDITTVLSSVPLSADYLHDLPANLKPYTAILLAAAALVRLKEDDISRLIGFVEGGGRLMFACDAFMAGSVPSANRVLTNYGLEMVNQDYGKTGEAITVTNLVSDPLSRGVERLVFHHPALINIVPGASAKAVALAPDQQGAFVAVARMTNGGEVAALSASLWWYWVYQFKTNSDNARLMENLLAPFSGKK